MKVVFFYLYVYKLFLVPGNQWLEKPPDLTYVICIDIKLKTEDIIDEDKKKTNTVYLSIEPRESSTLILNEQEGCSLRKTAIPQFVRNDWI